MVSVFYGALLGLAILMVLLTVYRKKAEWYNLVGWCIIVTFLCVKGLLEIG